MRQRGNWRRRTELRVGNVGGGVDETVAQVRYQGQELGGIL